MEKKEDNSSAGKNMTDLSIIILSHKSKDHLAVLLPSVFASRTKYSYEVIVVDNGSNDGTLEWLQGQLKDLKIIENKNTGFATGNNIGIKQSLGKYILLLNPDTKIEQDTLETMLDFMEQHPDVGISGCKLIKADGALDLACRRRFPNPTNSFKRLFLKDNRDYNYSNIDENQSMEVDSVVGAFLLIRRSVVDKIGLLDENFFMYGEDLDWCWRSREAGFKVWYYPKTSILHYKAESSSKTPMRTLKWHRDAMLIFYKKHYWQKYSVLFNCMVVAGIWLKYFLSVIVNSLKGRSKVRL